MSTISRRDLLLSVPALALAPRLLGQAAKPAIAVKGLNYFVLSVSDMKRSIDFYQGLFGMPIQARQGDNVLLRIGKGPQFLMLTPAGSNPPSIVPRLGLKVDNFNAERIVGMLEQHGVTRAAAGDPGLTGGAMKVRVSRRGPDKGGAADGTPEFFLGDPDDFVLQIQDVSYAGGAGALGNVPKVEESPKKGLIALSDMSHFTIGASDANRTQTFYQEVFGAPVRSRQASHAGDGHRPRRHVPDVHRRRWRTRWTRARCRARGGRCRSPCAAAGSSRERESREREHGELQARRSDEDARVVRHQRGRQQCRSAQFLHHASHAGSWRCRRRHARTVLQRSRWIAAPAAGRQVLWRRRISWVTYVWGERQRIREFRATEFWLTDRSSN